MDNISNSVEVPFVKYPCCSLLCRGGPEGPEGQRETGGERDQQPETGQEDQGIV
jgi:hypothetical protein